MKHMENTLRLVFWELTKRCNLRCVHCRAEALDRGFEGEMTTDEARRVLDDIASFSSPIVVLTGGEPLMRADIFDIARYAKEKKLRTALATNGTLIDAAIAGMIKDAGIQRVSISLDGKNESSHDGFRGVAGSFRSAMNGARLLREHGLYEMPGGPSIFCPRTKMNGGLWG